MRWQESRRRARLVGLLLLALSACDDGDPAPPAAPLDGMISPDMARPDATPVDMRLAPTDMAPADMQAADMAPADMQAADMAQADMAPADMAPADMTPADMQAADMAPADMAPADMQAADMAPADMTPIDMAPADPCAAVDCAAAPPPDCVDAATRRTYAPDGVCEADAEGARCVHAAEQAPCDPGEICLDGQCSPPPPPRPDELVITEFIPDPTGALADRFAQWVELQNVSARPLPLDGCVVQVDRGEAALAGTLAPGGVLLVGNGDEPALNGDLDIAAVFDATLSVRGGTLAVRCGEVEVDRVAFGRRPDWPVHTGYALALDPARRSAAGNDAPDAWCAARAIYLRGETPSDDNRGSPGVENPSCTVEAAFARTQAPTRIVAGPGAEVQVFGRVRHPGLTDRTVNTDFSPLVIAEVGYGPDGSVPDAEWTWQRAGPNLAWAGDEPDIDEYQRILEIPDRGAYDLAWRFSVDGGRSWLLGDTEAGSADGYAPADAAVLLSEGVARVRNTGEVVISEIFFATDLLGADAQWIEVHNTLDEPLDLSGCSLESPDFVRSALDGLMVPAGGWLAIPRVADAAVNGGIDTPVGYGFFLPGAGTLAVTCRFEVDRVRWDAGVLYHPVVDAALQLSGDTLAARPNDDPGNWCPAEAIYDAASGRRGTPGAANDACDALTGYPVDQVVRLAEAHCGECHMNGESLGDLSLEPFVPNTYGIASAQLPQMPLITPGDRQQSYLWHKISATHFQLEGGDGVQMPPGMPFEPGVIERFGLYIDALPAQ